MCECYPPGQKHRCQGITQRGSPPPAPVARAAAARGRSSFLARRHPHLPGCAGAHAESPLQEESPSMMTIDEPYRPLDPAPEIARATF
jgi:hypothetical protein